MKREIKVLRFDGTVELVCTYINELSPKENLRNFIIAHRFRSANFWDEKLQAKADALIKEGKGHWMYKEDMDVYLITKRTSMELRIKQVTKLLTEFGVNHDVSRCAEPNEILRGSWYVDKLMELGYKQCVHIDLVGENCFFAILDDGKVMTGKNIYIEDAFFAMADRFGGHDCESVVDKMHELGFKIYTDGDWDEDACVICPHYDAFEDFMYFAKGE